MHKPLLLLAALCCTLTFFAQKSDTLKVFYKPDQYQLSGTNKQQLDSFLRRGWDRLTIYGFTDETESDEYNLELSKRRSGTVYRYILSRNIPAAVVEEQYFGESLPQGDNDTEEGRAMNRRTLVIGYQFPEVKIKPAVPATDLTLPVTRSLDNGFLITYRPGLLPEYMAGNFESGSGADFRLITNTVQMRENGLFNNTTNGEILSSMLIICARRIDPCKLESPVLIKVPVPADIQCPVTKVKFFSAVLEKGRRIWKEQTKTLIPETIGGIQYVGVWLDDFCECINFDFKVDPDCFETDSTRLYYTSGTISNLSTELKGINSVYMPRKINDSTHSILFLKNKLEKAPVSFTLYKNKKRIRSFKDKILTDFPYDSASGRYLLGTGRKQFHFPRLDVWDMVLYVNGDRYRVPQDNHRFDFTYLQYKADSMWADFTIMESKKRVVTYRKQKLSSLPYDPVTGFYIIDKKFLKELNQKTTLAGR